MNELGKKNDEDKIRTDLYSFQAFLKTCKILTFGAKKYGDNNWKKGINFNRVLGAILRHLIAWWLDEDNDKETGENHLHHAACELMFLQHFVENKEKYKNFDNRDKNKKI